MRSEGGLFRRVVLVAILLGGAVACSSTEKAGIVLKVDTPVGVNRQAMTALQVAVDGTVRGYAVTTSSDWSLGIVTSAGSKLVVVDGLSGTIVIARSDPQTIVAKKGEVVTVDVVLTPVSPSVGLDGGGDGPLAAGGTSGADASPDDAALVGTGGNVSTGGIGGSGGGTGAAGIDGGRESGGIPGAGGLVGTGGVLAKGGMTGAGGIVGVGGGPATGGDPGSSGGTGAGGAAAAGGAIHLGGTVGTGGIIGTGGIVGVGGVLGTGGVVGAGGIVGTGGVVGTGGIVGTGGVVGTGGIVGTGGVMGTGGATGTGGVMSDGCNSSSTPPSCYPCTIAVDGTQRTYYVQLPSGYASSTSYPVVFEFHPWGLTAEATLSLYQIRPHFSNAIYVAPQALGSGASAEWNNTNGRDIAFTKAILADMRAKYCVDTARIFSVGFSYGAVMSHTIGCEMSDVFRAIAPMSGFLISGADCSGTRPAIAMWGSAGVDDIVVPISNSRAARDKILQQNHCLTASTPVNPSPCTSYLGCDQGYPVTWCEWDGEHEIPSFAGSAIAEFFGQF